MSANATGTPTTNRSIPKFNTASDAPNGRGVNEMMDALDALMADNGTFIQKPAGIASGEVPVWNGAAWVRPTATPIAIAGLAGYPADSIKALFGDGTWKSISYGNYTPTLTASVSNPNLGTTGTTDGYFCQIGKFVHTFGRVNFGGTGVNAGSGVYRISLPVTASVPISNYRLGVGLHFHSATGGLAQPVCTIDANNTTYFIQSYTSVWPTGGGANVTDAAPWVWAAGDEMQWSICYKAV